LGFPASNPVETGVGARSRAEFVLLASWGRRRKGDHDADAQDLRVGEFVCGVELSAGIKGGEGRVHATWALGRPAGLALRSWAREKERQAARELGWALAHGMKKRGGRFGWASARPRQRKGGFLLSLFYFICLFILKPFSNQFETILNLAQNHTVQKYKCSSMNAHPCCEVL